jgi:hypothetical protein
MLLLMDVLLTPYRLINVLAREGRAGFFGQKQREPKNGSGSVPIAVLVLCIVDAFIALLLTTSIYINLFVSLQTPLAQH